MALRLADVSELGENDRPAAIEEGLTDPLRVPNLFLVAARLHQLIDSTSQKVALDAPKFALGVAGIRPAPENVSVSVGLQLKAGFIIDLTEPGARVPAAKVIDGEAGQVIDAKP